MSGVELLASTSFNAAETFIPTGDKKFVVSRSFSFNTGEDGLDDENLRITYNDVVVLEGEGAAANIFLILAEGKFAAQRHVFVQSSGLGKFNAVFPISLTLLTNTGTGTFSANKDSNVQVVVEAIRGTVKLSGLGGNTVLERLGKPKLGEVSKYNFSFVDGTIRTRTE